MKTIKNDFCLKMFLGNDCYRPALSSISLKNGYLYATNGSVACKIPADLCVKTYSEVEKYPDVESVFEKHVSVENKVVSVDTLFNDLMKVECCFKPKMIDCNDCNGDGTYVCDHCNSECDCKECKGTGKVAGTEIELSGEYNCTLFNRKYKLQYLNLIIQTAVYTGVKEVEIFNSITSGSIFTVGDFTILIMTVYENN
jgi:hypothetical protein